MLFGLRTCMGEFEWVRGWSCIIMYVGAWACMEHERRMCMMHG